MTVGSRWRARFTGFEITVVASFGGVLDAVKVEYRNGRKQILSARDLRRLFVRCE